MRSSKENSKVKAVQMRTQNNALYGYRAVYGGKRALALMKTMDNGELVCMDYIFLEDLEKDLTVGPCIRLENFIKA